MRSLFPQYPDDKRADVCVCEACGDAPTIVRPLLRLVLFHTTWMINLTWLENSFRNGHPSFAQVEAVYFDSNVPIDRDLSSFINAMVGSGVRHLSMFQANQDVTALIPQLFSLSVCANRSFVLPDNCHNLTYIDLHSPREDRLCNALLERGLPIGLRISYVGQLECYVPLLLENLLTSLQLGCHPSIRVSDVFVEACCLVTSPLTHLGLCNFTSLSKSQMAVLGSSNLKALELFGCWFEEDGALEPLVLKLNKASVLRELAVDRSSKELAGYVTDALSRGWRVKRINLGTITSALEQSLNRCWCVLDIRLRGNRFPCYDTICNRNKQSHARARDAATILIMLKKFRKQASHLLYLVPADIMRDIAACVWSTRAEPYVWVARKTEEEDNNKRKVRRISKSQ